jgi:heterodisulfide reductase subunit C
MEANLAGATAPVASDSLQDRINALVHENTQLCYHCHKCTAGCPVSYAMERGPDRILRMVQLEQLPVLGSPDIWLCAGCETCGARCPNGIDIAHVMDALRQVAQAEGIRPAVPHVALFHEIFLRIVRTTGQMHEMSLLGGYKLLSGDLFSDLGAGARLILRGKVPVVPKVSRSRARVRRVFAADKDGR